jgi:hypothetical protein
MEPAAGIWDCGAGIAYGKGATEFYLVGFCAAGLFAASHKCGARSKGRIASYLRNRNIAVSCESSAEVVISMRR